MRAARRPTHLLLGVHPAVHQPLHRAFGDRRGDWLLVPLGRCIIDDDIGLPAYICFELTEALLQSRCKLVGLRRLSIGDIKRDENIDILGASAGSERHRR
jgi:hypothetical protein